jgi:KDO2-lipid IV(A) lauroyltransferase
LASPKLRAFRSRVLYRALILITVAGKRIPLKTGQRMGRAMGTLAWYIVRRERNKALRNLTIAFPEWDDAKRRATIKAMFRHFGMSLFEIAWLWTMDLASRERTTTWEGDQRVLDLVDSGRAVIMFTAHVGNWEWLTASVGLWSRPTNVLHRERDEEEMNRYIKEFRARVGVRTLDRGSTAGTRDMIQAIRRGGIMAFLIDQNIRTESVKVPFFGRPAPTPIGPAKFAIRTESVVVPTFMERRPNGMHHITFLEPIDCKRGDDPVALTARLTRDIENHIRRVPEQWPWMHDRWRERPKWDVSAEYERAD